MKQISIVTAILMAIKEFGDNRFTIYEITKAIRNKVRDGEYELRYDLDIVNHDNVKEHFIELVGSGLLDNYYVRYSPNGYREYSKNPVASTPAPDPTTVVQNAVNGTNIPKDVQKIIYNYMKNNGQVSMKRIQSRLKGYNYTCQEIKDFLDKINLIDPQSSVYPPSQAWTVKI